MSHNSLQIASEAVGFKQKLKDIALLTKLRLSFLVVFSSILSYFLAADVVSIQKILALIVGGFLVTGGANGLNQVIEKDLDKLMKRTADRPLPTGRMSSSEALSISIIIGFIGVLILGYFLNTFSGVLGLLALFLYAAVYTPLKRITPFAVFVGAFPGAIPPMLGYIAETGTFGMIPGILFFVQFIWQFPHFWAIAWKVDDDYSKAGFSLLPSPGRKDKRSAFLIMTYSVFLIPVSLLPIFFNVSGMVAAVVCLIAGLWFLFYAIKLYYSCSDKAAKTLMFASFFYLPIVQIVYLLDKI